MIKKTIILCCTLFFFWASHCFSASLPALAITGEVAHPLNFTIKDLQKFDSVTVRLNEVSKNGEYHGAFYYQGPSLRTLLELAVIQKKNPVFNKQLDLAIMATNKAGEKVLLSWGELFYKNHADIIVAVEATPIIPHHEIQDIPKRFWPYLEPLKRKVELPKLVVANDFYSDRSLEGIVSVEVIDLRFHIPQQKLSTLFSPSFFITGNVENPYEIDKLDFASKHRSVISYKEVGDGQGYHGTQEIEGVPLSLLLDKAGISYDLNTAIVVSAPDGYRSLLSYGELFMSNEGKRILISDKFNQETRQNGGVFFLTMTDDLSADRNVKAIDTIEVINLSKKSKLFIIEIGSGTDNLMTAEAIYQIAKADVFVCSQNICERFSRYIDDKPVLFDPVTSLSRASAQNGSSSHILEERTQAIVSSLESKKTVVYLDYGNPASGGSWRFLLDRIKKDKIEVLGETKSFNPSNALIQQDISKRKIGSRNVTVIADSKKLKTQKQAIQAIARNGDTLAIITSLEDFRSLLPVLDHYFLSTTPLLLTYTAPYSGKNKEIPTTLKDVLTIIDKENEKLWKLTYVYIGAHIRNSKK